MLCTCILLLLTYTSVGRCFIEEIELPPSLRDCLRMKTKYQDVTKSPSESVCNTCVSRYLWMSGPNLQKCDHPNDNTTISDISNLFGKLLCEETSRKRTKRQTRYIPFRKELRMLTRAERQRLRRAWRRAYDSGVSFMDICYLSWLRMRTCDILANETTVHQNQIFILLFMTTTLPIS